MFKTTLVWLCIYISGIFISFVKGPIYALLVYMFTYFTQFSWAKPYIRERWSLYASIATLVVYLIKKNSEIKLSHFKVPQMKWLVLYLINMLLVTPMAVNPTHNFNTIIDFVKLIVIYYLIVAIVRTKLHYKTVLWLQLWGNYLFGWQAFHKGRTGGGRLEGIGGPQTSTSNGLANFMVMILPFLNSFFFYGNKWEKIAAVYAAPWILNAIILCNSRGAFLSMLVVAVLCIFRASKKNRKKIIVGLILGIILFIQLADERFWIRMDTINDPNQEGSGRLETWAAALRMIGDHPLGAGGGGWLYYSPVYIPDIVDAHEGELRSVHNSYLEVATNYGIQGAFFYFAFIASTLLQLRKMRKRSGAEGDLFYHAESTAIELAIWAFLIAATFGARPYFEAFYWYSALGCALNNIQLSDIADRMNKQARATVQTVNEN